MHPVTDKLIYQMGRNIRKDETNFRAVTDATFKV